MSPETTRPATPSPVEFRRVWIGHWLMAVAALHTLFALAVFNGVLLNLVRRGLFDTVGEDAMTAAAVWFLLFGVVLALLALATTALEQSGQTQTLRRLGLGLLALGALGVILMPASGFWLCLPAAAALLRKRG